MNLRKRLKNPSVAMRVGMSSLILASASRFFLHPRGWLSADMVDAVTGFLYGIAIATLLLSVVLHRRDYSPPRS